MKSEEPGDALCDQVRHDGLYDEYNGYDSEFDKLVGVELGGQFRKDWSSPVSPNDPSGLQDERECLVSHLDMA